MDIQRHVNRLSYNAEPTSYAPRRVILEGTAHCFEGALFAAAALRWMGHRPLIVDLVAENDDDHVVAVFRRNGRWGAIAKSNTTVLRFREPVYRSIFELTMSYFDMYFNTRGEKTLRSYSRPVELTRFDPRGWMESLEEADYISDYLYTIPHRELLSGAMKRCLEKTDPALQSAGFMGANTAGLYKPGKK
ncbi:MAG: hypothetical protein NTV54_09380 [Ignavibacteriales bacterium]|nr:hypothetical protein [Ignavibacteriales bacterium]